MSKAARPLLLLLAVAGPLAPAARAEGPDTVALDAPATVDGLLVADVDGDGAADVLVRTGRVVRLFRGRAGALPAAAPAGERTVPGGVSFVDAAPPVEGGAPALLALGRQGLVRLAFDGAEPAPLPDAGSGLDWADPDGCVFADLVDPDGAAWQPTADGWRWVPPEASGHHPVEVAIPPLETLEPPGDFLGDTGVVTRAWPRPWRGPAPQGAAEGALPTLWAIGGTRLVAVHGQARRTWDLSFLPAAGDRRLVDLDGDGAPEVVHRETTNRTGTYAFFRVPRPVLEGGALAPEGGDLRPPSVVLRLGGYQLEPEYVDLDGDGRRDFAVTAIPVDARNTARALGGQVTAHTYAFLDRARGPDEPLFATTPDASVTSDIGVAIRFSPAGNIEVERSFTIVVTGDYDGDGRLDLAIRTGPSTLTIRRGTADGVWAAEGREVALPALEEAPDLDAHPADLDGDGDDELLLHYRRPGGGGDRLYALDPGRG